MKVKAICSPNVKMVTVLPIISVCRTKVENDVLAPNAWAAVASLIFNPDHN